MAARATGAGGLLARLTFSMRRLQGTFDAFFFGNRYPPDAFCLGVIGAPQESKTPSGLSLKDLWGEGFLWGVPTFRRTIEKRWKRKYGWPQYKWKMLVPKSNLQMCNVCGDDHEIGVLCPTCYKKVIEETKEMQDAIQEKLQLSPVENEVVVLYDGEPNQSEFHQGKRIVEMNKPRPSWFSKNLLQETTQEPATTTDVKPSNLG